MSRVVAIGIAVVALLDARAADASCMCGGGVLTDSVAEGSPTIVFVTTCPPKKPPAFSFTDADGNKVGAKVTATFHGHKTVQYVLQPTKALRPARYMVVVPGESPDDRHAVTVVAAAKPTPIKWTRDPSVIAQSQHQFGCGPSKSVEIGLEVTPAKLAFIELTDETDKTSSAGFVSIAAKSPLSIGHGMCGGPFSLEPGHKYTVAISIVAADGTISPSKLVSFTFAPKSRSPIRITSSPTIEG